MQQKTSNKTTVKISKKVNTQKNVNKQKNATSRQNVNMQKNVNKPKKSLAGTIVIVLLSISMVFFLFTTVVMLRETHYSYRAAKEDQFYYDVQDHDYSYLLRAVRNNEAIGYQPTENEKEYYALAEYYENAYLYQMYMSNDQPEKAADCKKKMDDAEGRTGFLSGEISYIQELFGM